MLAHQNPIRRAKLSARFERVDRLDLLAVACNLTELYTAVEHLVPDVVLLSREMASAPEFEVMRALFSALHVACILLEGDNDVRPVSPLTDGLPSLNEAADAEELVVGVRAAASRPLPRFGREGTVRLPVTEATMPAEPRSRTPTFRDGAIVLIGASTGGVDALLTVLGQFPVSCPPTFVVQHTGGRFVSSLISLLDRSVAAKVTAATDGEEARIGHIYLAPGDQAHLALSQKGKLITALDPGAHYSGHRPSVDVLFRSAVPRGRRVAAALLTGMGRDGAVGLKALSAAGAETIVQDEATSVVYGMPRVAWEMGAARQKLPIDRIGPALLAACAVTTSRVGH
ncbi:CheB methylesterase domain-containing protein [Pelagovum pacificum]|uniref:CheB methylesterase domain-containing protein n=1 Tax=Pelagovum pacificum TaxID=2588711 RepID=UPI00111CD861|nr:CheB methylesterase domain-containing protein [Pelagovum pacificum]